MYTLDLQLNELSKIHCKYNIVKMYLRSLNGEHCSTNQHTQTWKRKRMVDENDKNKTDAQSVQQMHTAPQMGNQTPASPGKCEHLHSEKKCISYCPTKADLLVKNGEESNTV